MKWLTSKKTILIIDGFNCTHLVGVEPTTFGTEIQHSIH